MAFRVPERRTPTRLSLNEALDYVLRGSISADYQNHEIGWLLHQAYTRLLQFAMTPPHFRDAVMQPLPQFTIDPVLVAKAILDGIESRALSVDDLPPEFLAIWQARPFVSDWSLGFVNFAREGKREGRTVSDKRRFRPTLLLDEVDALFRETGPASPIAAEERSLASDDENTSNTKSHIRTGPRPDETDRLKQAMRDMGLTELKRSTLEELMARLGSKQTATWQAKKDVLSDLEKGISQKTPNKEN